VVTVRSSKRFAALAILVTLVALAAPAGIADADTPVAPWRIVASPNLGTIDNHLQEVSCVSSVRCMAVGFNEHPTTFLRRSVAATLSGGAWKLLPVPTRGTDINNLWNVSCVSATRCVAVGSYYNIPSGYYKTLIATFNGSVWTLAATPNRPNVHNYLFGVDCADATHCVAVGRTFDPDPLPGKSQSLVLTLNGGTTWSMPTVPQRADADNLLADVSCGDVTNCKAVGYTIDATANPVRTLILSLSTGTWTIDTSVDRPSASNLLRDISCPTATTCVAVGASDPDPNAFAEQSLIETFSGGTWAFATSPDRAGFDNHLWAVSCSNETNCVAAGQSQNDDLARPLIQTLAAGTWGLTSPSPYRAGTFNYLYGLSCPTYRNCKAVGDYRNPVSGRFRTSVLTNSPP
jgi:hypothetical protein